MKTKTGSLIFGLALCLSMVLTGACAAEANSKKAQGRGGVVGVMQAFGDVVARPGESEIVIENTLPSEVKVFINGQFNSLVKARSYARIVVPDGNQYVRVQSSAKGTPTSRELQFYARATRFHLKTTAPNPNSVSLTRESAHDLTIPNSVGSVADGAAGGADFDNEVPLSETALGKDKAAMFERLDLAAPVPAAQPAAAPSQPAPVAVPAPAPAPAPAAAAPAPAAQQPAERQQIAVYVTGDKDDGVKKALGTKMLVALVNSGRFVAVERTDDFLAEIDREHIKQRSETVDENQISALGKQFGARFVCVANISSALGSYQVSARIIDVETAVVVAVGEGSSQLRNMDDLSIVSARVVRALLKE